jgi:hypothetical protein
VPEVLGGRLGGFELGGERHCPIGEEPFAPGDHAVPVDDAVHAESFEVREAFDGGQCGDLLASTGGDGLGDRMLGGVLQCTGEPDDAVGPNEIPRRLPGAR